MLSACSIVEYHRFLNLGCLISSFLIGLPHTVISITLLFAL